MFLVNIIIILIVIWKNGYKTMLFLRLYLLTSSNRHDFQLKLLNLPVQNKQFIIFCFPVVHRIKNNSVTIFFCSVDA